MGQQTEVILKALSSKVESTWSMKPRIDGDEAVQMNPKNPQKKGNY
jgi:hypothetical protein